MKLIIIFGPQAVGKMTVGHELEKITDLKLFHNHMTIELVSPFFSYGTKTGKRLVNLFRKEILENKVQKRNNCNRINYPQFLNRPKNFIIFYILINLIHKYIAFQG